jgi:23S rRNA G2069 N7-methylase RlmK/C1962 C5-methylase RlmI
MFKVFGRVKEILTLLLDVAEKLRRIHELCDRMEKEHQTVITRLNDIQTRVHTIERVEDLILRQNEQLLGRVMLPPDLRAPGDS